MVRYSLFAIFLISFTIAWGQSPLDQLDIPNQHQQVVLVTTSSWSDSTATLQLYSRTNEDSGWVSSGQQIEVMIGRNGLAWGKGLHAMNKKPAEKIEGDGKAPAGIFGLAEAFGYPKDLKARYPYRQATSRDYWIDDVNSSDYNQWVSLPDTVDNNPELYWGSYEKMRRDDHLYELGIIVNHNTSPVTKGMGSAIFMHIWKGAGLPTAGCTAMPKDDLVQVLEWLDPDQQPLLVQVPVGEFDKLQFK